MWNVVVIGTQWRLSERFAEIVRKTYLLIELILICFSTGKFAVDASAVKKTLRNVKNTWKFFQKKKKPKVFCVVLILQ